MTRSRLEQGPPAFQPVDGDDLSPEDRRRRELEPFRPVSAWQTIRDLMGEATAEGPGLRPYMVAVVQTLGEELNLHPHVHALAIRGGWTASGHWIPVPYASPSQVRALLLCLRCGNVSRPLIDVVLLPCLLALFPSCTYRIRVDRDELALVVAQLVRELDYVNFNDAVRERQGAKRAKAYGRVYGDLRTLEG